VVWTSLFQERGKYWAILNPVMNSQFVYTGICTH